MNGTVLSLCDRTGNMVLPWAESGYECICVDIRHSGKISRHPSLPIEYVGADVRQWLPPRRHYAAAFAFPPCTDLAISGARWFRDKGLSRLIEALEVVEACRRLCDWTGAPWMLENPVSTISTCWREPDYTFNPCDFGGYLDPPGDAYTKRTCLWVGGGFILPAPKPVPPAEGSRMHLMSPSDHRADDRAETPMGFALAVFEANSMFTLEVA